MGWAKPGTTVLGLRKDLVSERCCQPEGRHNRCPARECWETVPFKYPESLQGRHLFGNTACRPVGLVPSATPTQDLRPGLRLFRPAGCGYCRSNFQFANHLADEDLTRSPAPVITNTANLEPYRDTIHVSHTYSSTLFHIVFSTKERRTAIQEPPKLWAYVAGTARNLGYEALAIGGTENHLHMLLRLPAHIPIADAAQKLKSNSSRWLRENRSWPGWQQGYGAFSVSRSNVDAVRHYIQNQPEHHRRHSFEEEFLTLLTKSGIAFNKAEVFE